MTRSPAAVIVAALLASAALAGCATAPSARAEPRFFRDCADCPEMAALPPGRFPMGTPEAEALAEDLANANFRMHLPVVWTDVDRPFAISRREVTRGEFAQFVSATGYVAGKGCNVVGAGGSWGFDAARDWQDPGLSQSADHPVVCVSYEDMVAYANWISQRAGRTYRLPTEVEWEYAARGGTVTARWWGDAREPACRYANVPDRNAGAMFGWGPDRLIACDDGFGATAPVGSFEANPFGLHDMIGNVWEFTSACTEPECRGRIVRGGSFGPFPHAQRSAARSVSQTARSNLAGFRLVAELEPVR